MSIRLTRRAALSATAAVALPAPALARQLATATPDDTALAEQVDAYVKRAMAGFPDQPAVSIGVVRDGKTVLARGYGVREIGGAAADENTLFAIASTPRR